MTYSDDDMCSLNRIKVCLVCHAFDKYDFLLSYVAFCKCICSAALTRFSWFVRSFARSLNGFIISLSRLLISFVIKLMPLPHHTAIIHTEQRVRIRVQCSLGFLSIQKAMSNQRLSQSIWLEIHAHSGGECEYRYAI